MAVNATAIWRVRPSGSNNNGGGYDPGISGAATDYSQQNSAQATGTLGTSTASTTFTDAGGAFTAAMVGNALWIASGSGFNVSAYFITGYTNSTTITLDRASGTGTAAHWAVGGGWADFTNVHSGTGCPLVDGNIVYALGSGTPNPSSYTYDYTVSTAVVIGTNVLIANDPATPGYKAPPDTTGGMPVIKHNLAGEVFSTPGYALVVQGVWFVATTTAASHGAIIITENIDIGCSGLFGCVYDQFSFDTAITSAGTVGYAGNVIGTEVFSSVAAGSAGSLGGINVIAGACSIIGCNIHDCVGYGILGVGAKPCSILNSIVAKCGVDGIKIYISGPCMNNTIDGNAANGITVQTAGGYALYYGLVLNNIISNHTAGGAVGFNVPNIYEAGAVLNVDYQVYYNNTTHVSSVLGLQPHDTVLGVTPYVGQATENYTLA